MYSRYVRLIGKIMYETGHDISHCERHIYVDFVIFVTLIHKSFSAALCVYCAMSDMFE